jgi:hypothetical protein
MEWLLPFCSGSLAFLSTIYAKLIFSVDLNGCGTWFNTLRED